LVAKRKELQTFRGFMFFWIIIAGFGKITDLGNALMDSWSYCFRRSSLSRSRIDEQFAAFLSRLNHPAVD
jgi:hypothetical protein